MKKIVVELVIIMMILMGMVTNVQAASFTFSVSPNKTSIAPGEEIELTLSISNIDLGENGMNTLEGVLVYDKDVFETVTASSIISLNNWAFTYNDENTDLNGKFLGIVLNNGIKENQSIATIKLKAKAGLKSQETTITIKDIATNDGTNLVETADKNVKISIVNPNDKNQTGTGNNGAGTNGNGAGTGNNSAGTNGNGAGTGNNGTGTNGTGTENNGAGTNGNGTGTGNNSAGTNGNGAGTGNNGTGTNGNGAGTGNNGTSTSGKNNADQLNKKLPQTGTNEVYVISAIVVISIISLALFIKYKKI